MQPTDRRRSYPLLTLLACTWLVAVACDTSETSREPPVTNHADDNARAESAPVQNDDRAEAESAPAPNSDPLQEPVDLLRAVDADLATSSAYRNQRTQVERLIDGDPRTAWNSRTGDLVGAWIEVRLPSAAQVTGISFIPGFANHNGTTDLFTGNHRVSRVRIFREGIEVGTFAVATENPDFVTIPVSGQGGVWRIEFVEMLPGSRSTWREACISELRVLGRMEGMTPSERVPRLAVGALPGARAVAAVDPRALDRAHQWLSAQWHDYIVMLVNVSPWAPESPFVIPRPARPQTIEDLNDELDDFNNDTRGPLLRRIATLVEPFDAVRADALRLVGRQRPTEMPLVGDVEAIGAALDIMADRVGASDARCRNARALAGMLLEYLAMVATIVDPEDGGAVSRDANMLTGLWADWRRDPSSVMTRHVSYDRRAPPLGPPLGRRAEWITLRARLQAMQAHCH